MRRLGTIAWLGALLLYWSGSTAAVAASLGAPAPAPRAFSHYVPARDGTRLAVTVLLPGAGAKPKRFSSLFLQTRSALLRATGRGGIPASLLPYLEHGYALVLQDRRGEGASFGVQKGFVTRDDARDGAAVIEWAARQPWSDGKLGAMGCSNQGAFQLPVAAEHPPHLLAVAPECASPFFFDTMISPNGVSAFAMGAAPAYDGACDSKASDQIGVPVDEDRAPSHRLAHAAALEHRCNANFLGQYSANMHRDTRNEFLDYAPGEADSIVGRADAVRTSGVKVFQIGGWFDASPGGQLQGWQLFGGRVLIGPWLHCGTDDPGGGYGDAHLDRVRELLRWFDYVLRGIDDGISREAPVRIYTMHARAGREWLSSRAWPLPDQRLQSYFLAGDPGAGESRARGGILSRVAPAVEGEVAYRPDLGVSWFDGAYNELHRYWTGDMSATDRRGVPFDLPTLAGDLQVTGHPVAHLWVASTAADEDFFAVLEDVAADGRSTYVTDGKQRASRRALATPPWGELGTPWHSQKSADDLPLQPGVAVELDFDFTPTSWVFQAGHHPRVTLFNAAGPRFQSPPARANGLQYEDRILWGGTHASRIDLPIIEAGSASYAGAQPAAGIPGMREAAGTLASGARWRARVPANWNGTLLLYSHGYWAKLAQPELAPRDMEERLLAEGYALAASAYARPGWAVAEAVPDQLATLQAFSDAFRKPRRTIAWGESMGGLVTVALAEQHAHAIDAGLSACGSIGGVLAMMNVALDGAFAFKTLLAPDSQIELQHVGDDRANAARVSAVVAAAMMEPEGRARLALAAALGQVALWSDPDLAAPVGDEAQLAQVARTFANAVFLPRSDMEQRGGGALSWLTGVDFRDQLARSGRAEWVKAFYSRAGLDLEQDLRRLQEAPREDADPGAVDYMGGHYVPSGMLGIPVLSYHTVGDGLTAVEMQSGYRAAVRDTGNERWFRPAWVNGAGHCRFLPQEHLAALHALEARLDDGEWHSTAQELNDAARRYGNAPGRFIDFEAPPLLRPCRTGGACPGRPAGAQ